MPRIFGARGAEKNEGQTIEVATMRSDGLMKPRIRTRENTAHGNERKATRTIKNMSNRELVDRERSLPLSSCSCSTDAERLAVTCP